MRTDYLLKTSLKAAKICGQEVRKMGDKNPKKAPKKKQGSEKSAPQASSSAAASKKAK